MNTNVEIIANLLKKIPRSDEPALSLDDWITSAGNGANKESAEFVILLLNIFGALTPYDSNNPIIKPCSQIGHYFSQSLASYIANKKPIVSDWIRSGVGNLNLPFSTIFEKGAQFLWAMEYHRVNHFNLIEPSRIQEIAVVLIKSNLIDRNEPGYLVQYDNRSHQYQLIGGRVRKSENPESTAYRELKEEMARNNFDKNYNVKLNTIINKTSAFEFSHTFGAYTRYDVSLYHAKIKANTIVLGPTDRWATTSEMMSGKIDEVRFTTLSLNILENSEEKLKDLPLSIETPQRYITIKVSEENSSKPSNTFEPHADIRRWTLSDLKNNLNLGSIYKLLGIIITLCVMSFALGKCYQDWSSTQETIKEIKQKNHSNNNAGLSP